MGRPKTPISKAILTGARDRNPQRYRGEAPKSDYPVGNPPDSMPRDVKMIWPEILEQCADGVMTAGERIMLELACYLIYEFRAMPGEFPSAKMTNLRGILGSFGLAPSNRHKLGVYTEVDDDWCNI